MDNSPFKKLPPELRNLVYEPSLQRSRNIWLHIERRGQSYAVPGVCLPSITQVCREMRSETKPFFFKLNKFAYDIRFIRPIGHTTDIIHALKLFGRVQTNVISQININIFDAVGARRPAIIRLIWTFAQMAILGLPLKAVQLNAGEWSHIYSNEEMKARLEEWMGQLLLLGHGLGKAGFSAEVTMRDRYLDWQFQGEGRRFVKDEACAMILSRIGIRDTKAGRRA